MAGTIKRLIGSNGRLRGTVRFQGGTRAFQKGTGPVGAPCSLMGGRVYVDTRGSCPLARGYSVDVGTVEYRHRDAAGKEVRTQLEVDFVATAGGRTMYVQVAQGIDDEGKREQEIGSLLRVRDSFKKVVLVRDHIVP